MNRRAYSPVIAALLLSAVVLSVGGAVWAYSQASMAMSSEDYAEAMIDMTETICERFIIEHAYHDGANILIFVFNYGDVDIEVKVQAKEVTYPADQDTWVKIPSGEMKEFLPIALSASPGETINIRAYTKRGNDAFYRYLVPQV